MSLKENGGKELTELVDRKHPWAMTKAILSIIQCMGFNGPFDTNPQVINEYKKGQIVENFNALLKIQGKKEKELKKPNIELSKLMKSVSMTLKPEFFRWPKANTANKIQTNEYRLDQDDAYPEAKYKLWKHYEDWTSHNTPPAFLERGLEHPEPKPQIMDE